MIQFKILRCDADAAHLLGFAKGKVRDLVEAGVKNFTRTWLVDGTTITARSMVFMGDQIVRLTLSGTTDVFNRVARDYLWQPLYNFRVAREPPTEDARAAVKWYDRIQAVELDAFGHSLSFKVITEATPLEKNMNLLGLSNFSKARVLSQLRAHVVRESIGARYWLGILTRYLSISYLARSLPGQPGHMLVSRPNASGKFYILWGFWDIPRDDEFVAITSGHPLYDPKRPQDERFNGIIISIDDLEKQASADPTRFGVDLDHKLNDPTYVGPTLIGRLWSNNGERPELIATGFDYRRKQRGLFNFSGDLVNIPAGLTVGERFYYNYRPEEATLIPRTGSAFAALHVDIEGVTLGLGIAYEQLWTQTNNLHTLSASGVPTVSALPSPVAPGSMTYNLTSLDAGNGAIFAASGFEADMAFFDGEALLRVGSMVQTPTFQNTVTGEFLHGQYTITVALPVNDVPPASGTLDQYYKDYGIARIRNPNTLVRREHFDQATYSLTTPRSISSHQGPASMRSWYQGPVLWGRYTSVMYEQTGFTTPGRSPLILGFAEFIPQQGIFWYRREGPMGIFVYEVFGADLEWKGDCEKYRNVYLEVPGYRSITNPGGSITIEEHYEDLEVILTRIMSRVQLVINNFGTAAMVPWFENLGFYVIVER